MMGYVSSAPHCLWVEVYDVQNSLAIGPAVYKLTLIQRRNHSVCWPQVMEVTDEHFGKRWWAVYGVLQIMFT